MSKRGARLDWRDRDKWPDRLKRAVDKALADDCPAVPPPNLEPDPGGEPQRADVPQKAGTPCRVHFHSIRKRLCDPDGISCKWCLDAIVSLGILPDDNADIVREVSYSQRKTVKGEEEKTIITLTWDE